jgi:hypothetical protein
VDLSVVDLERFPHRQLIATALAHAAGHAPPDNAHTFIHGDDARLHITELRENRERLRGDVLTAWRELAVRSRHDLSVLVGISVGREGCLDVGEGLSGIESFRVFQRRFDRLVSSRELFATRRVIHHRTRRAQAIDVEDEPSVRLRVATSSNSVILWATTFSRTTSIAGAPASPR